MTKPKNNNMFEKPTSSSGLEQNPGTSDSRRVWRVAITVVLLLGLSLRCFHYFSNPSLWLDEAKLAINLLNRDLITLTEPLSENQGAPLGFLWVQWMIAQFFGYSELALRFLPFMASIGGLFFFRRLACKQLSLKESFFAVSVFAITPSLINYSAEFKQYSLDTFFAVLILLAYEHFSSKNLSLFSSSYLILLGAISIFFSHSSIFVLAGLGCVIFIKTLMKQNKLKLWQTLGIGSTWIMAFIANYYFSLRHLSSNNNLLLYWSDGFPPVKSIMTFLLWHRSAFMDIFQQTMDVELAFAGAALFLVGLYANYRNGKKTLTFLWLSPCFFVWLAALLRRYPFKERLLLFLIPSICLFLGVGSVHLLTTRKKWSKTVGLLFLGLFVLGVISTWSEDGFDGVPDEGWRDILAHVARQSTKNDVLYCHPGSMAQVDYYQNVYDYDLPPTIIASKKNVQHIARIRKHIKEQKVVWYVYPEETDRTKNITSFFNSQPSFESDKYTSADSGAHRFSRIQQSQE